MVREADAENPLLAARLEQLGQRPERLDRDTLDLELLDRCGPLRAERPQEIAAPPETD
jgi:hypothetical protein